jgi:hypothetical protein
MSIETHQHDDWLTGSEPVTTTLGTVATGNNVAARTPLGQVTATGKFVIWNPAGNDGSEKAVRMTEYAIDATSADKTGQLIKAGSFNPDLVAWPGGVTEIQKLTAFVGTPISLQAPA